MRSLITPALVFGLSACIPMGHKGHDHDTSTDTDATAETDTAGPHANTCGDAVLDEGEACDDGDANGPEASCLPDCTVNPNQHFALYSTDVSSLLDVVGVSDASAPSGLGAWSTSETDLNGDGTLKFELYLPLFDYTQILSPALKAQLDRVPHPPADWLGQVHISDITRISFDAKTDHLNNTYSIYIYTTPESQSAQWFGKRLIASPRYARNISAAAQAGVWSTFSTDGLENQLTWGDDAMNNGDFGHTDGPTLGELQGNTAYDWNNVAGSYPHTAVDYGQEVVAFIAVQSNSTTPGSTAGSLDKLHLELADGRTLSVDLEP